jgi:integrase
VAKLSEPRIRSLKPSSRDRWIGDGLGLWLRVRTTGKKTFVIRTKSAGKTRIITLGDWPQYSLQKARIAVLDRRTKRNATPDAYAAMAVKELAEEFYDRMIAPRYRRTKTVRGYLDNGIIPSLGKLKLRQVNRASVAGMVKDYVARGPVAANRLLTLTKQIFGYAVEMGYLDTNPAAAVTTRVAGGEETTRDRVLTDEEMRKVWHSESHHSALLRFLLLTLARIGETQKARWSDVKGARWYIPAGHSKNKKPHWIHLSEPATKLLQSLPQDADLVFGATSDTAVQAWVRRFCEREQISPAFTPHDLRRTSASRCGDLDIPPHIVEKLLNHTMQGALKVYNRAEYESERIEALNKLGAEIERIVHD